MKGPSVLVPFKGERLKSRLSPVLGAEQRKELAYLLLEDVLTAIRRASLEGRCWVVSPDSNARVLARNAGASFIRESRATGVNEAIRLGVRRLKGQGTFMVVPSDLALLSPPDLKQALTLVHYTPVVIAPSASFNGTNLLIFPRSMAPSLSYDNNSFWNHVSVAARLGLHTSVLTEKGLVFDVDTPAEARELAGLKVNTRAARFLRKSLPK